MLIFYFYDIDNIYLLLNTEFELDVGFIRNIKKQKTKKTDFDEMCIIYVLLRLMSISV